MRNAYKCVRVCGEEYFFFVIFLFAGCKDEQSRWGIK